VAEQEMGRDQRAGTLPEDDHRQTRMLAGDQFM